MSTFRVNLGSLTSFCGIVAIYWILFSKWYGTPEVLEPDFTGEGWHFELSRLEKLPAIVCCCLHPSAFLSGNALSKGEACVKQSTAFILTEDVRLVACAMLQFYHMLKKECNSFKKMDCSLEFKATKTSCRSWSLPLRTAATSAPEQLVWSAVSKGIWIIVSGWQKKILHKIWLQASVFLIFPWSLCRTKTQKYSK